MGWTETPLTVSSGWSSWRWDTITVVLTAALAIGYAGRVSRARQRGAGVPAGRVSVFCLLGLGVWLLTGISAVGVYADTLFWVRALQILLLLYVVPFGLASGRPVTILRESLGPVGRDRLDRVLRSSLARNLTYPLVPSLGVLATPWLVFMTPWYEIMLRNGAADAVTRIVVVGIGFLYFYSRLQTDPVPQRYSQGVSLLITAFESLADGVLGLVLWMGPLVAAGYYTEVGRSWGPDLRTDQVVAAGIIWVLGDVLGLPYLLALMRSWASDERRRAAEVDAALDADHPTAGIATAPEAAPVAVAVTLQSGLWWEKDPQLRQRFRR